MTAWPLVPLGEVLTKSEEWIKLDPLATYRQVTVRLWGQGVLERNVVTGQEIGSDTRLAVRAHQFLISRIDARNGAAGLVPESLDGAVVSSDFPAFTARADRLDPGFLGWYSKTAQFVQGCKAASEGTTNRVRLKEERFLNLTIALPLLEDQRRIVARIEGLAQRVHSARQLRAAAILQTANLSDSYIEAVFGDAERQGWKQYRLGDFVTEARYGTSEKTHDDRSGTPVLRMGNIQNGELVATDLKYLHLSEAEEVSLLLKPGDIVVNRTNSAELVGKCAVFQLEGDFAYASYLIRLRIDTKRAIPELLAAYINSSAGRAYMFAERKQMTGQANVNAQKLKMLPIRLPGLDEQSALLKGIEQVRSLAKRIRAEQRSVGLELSALMPSILNNAFSGKL